MREELPAQKRQKANAEYILYVLVYVCIAGVLKVVLAAVRCALASCTRLFGNLQSGFW
jgi:hypothetical protein